MSSSRSDGGLVRLARDFDPPPEIQFDQRSDLPRHQTAAEMREACNVLLELAQLRGNGDGLPDVLDDSARVAAVFGFRNSSPAFLLAVREVMQGARLRERIEGILADLEVIGGLKAGFAEIRRRQIEDVKISMAQELAQFLMEVIVNSPEDAVQTIGAFVRKYGLTSIQHGYELTTHARITDAELEGPSTVPLQWAGGNRLAIRFEEGYVHVYEKKEDQWVLVVRYMKP